MIAAILLNVVDWLETHQLSCPVKYYMHINCPGCGMQRSFTELLKGNIVTSFQLHPVTIPLLLFFLFSALHIFYKFKKGNTIIVYSYIFIALMVFINFIYNIIIPHI